MIASVPGWALRPVLFDACLEFWSDTAVVMHLLCVFLPFFLPEFCGGHCGIINSRFAQMEGSLVYIGTKAYRTAVATVQTTMFEGPAGSFVLKADL